MDPGEDAEEPQVGSSILNSPTSSAEDDFHSIPSSVEDHSGADSDSHNTTSSTEDHSDAVSSINLSIPAPTNIDQDKMSSGKDPLLTAADVDEAFHAFEQASALGKLTILVTMLEEYRELKKKLNTAEGKNKKWREVLNEDEDKVAESEMLLKQEEIRVGILEAKNAVVEARLRKVCPEAFDTEGPKAEPTGFEVTESPKVKPNGTKRSKGSKGSKRKASGRKRS